MTQINNRCQNLNALLLSLSSDIYQTRIYYGMRTTFTRKNVNLVFIYERVRMQIQRSESGKQERRKEATILILFSHLVINHQVDNAMWSSGIIPKLTKVKPSFEYYLNMLSILWN